MSKIGGWLTSGSAKGTRLAKAHAGPILMRREMVAFLPAVALAGLWFGLQAMVLLGATALIVAWMTRPLAVPDEEEEILRDGVTGLPLRAEAEEILGGLMREAATTTRATACLVLGFDEPDILTRQTTRFEYDEVLQRTADRLRGALRECDRVARLDGPRFAILLKPTPRPDLESMIQLSARLQNACEEPISIAARSITASCHVGFCLMKRAPEPTGKALLAAAEVAAEEARRNGPSAIRAFSSEVQHATQARNALSGEVAEALENGQITAYFQPQLSTDTGEISGMQVVPRWLHRERGVLTEVDILPAADSPQFRHRLAEVMLYKAFGALREWDRSSEPMGPVSLPLSPELMTNPKMAERLKWEFDRFEIAPGRIRLVLQQALSSQLDEEVIGHNLAALNRLGCQIELAGFGAGPASVLSIRRAGARRIRVHRSFVTHVDRDPEQQRLVAAIISFADGLGLETIAEGVATIGEHAMLAQLGCSHVQGRAIAMPMPLEETLPWIARHRAKLAETPQITRRGA